MKDNADCYEMYGYWGGKYNKGGWVLSWVYKSWWHVGARFFNRLEDVLVDLKLNIDDIRGKCYNNGLNMKGKHQSVKTCNLMRT